MVETANLNFYEIINCGYYERGSELFRYGNFQSLLTNLHTWVQNRPFELTKTYDSDDYKNTMPTYCFDLISNNNGNYLLTTWNETPTDQGNVASVNRNSNVGEYDVDVAEIDDDYVLGYPTYFWILPEQEIFATIRFNNPLNGHPNLKRFFTNFLSKYSQFVVVDEDGDEGNHEILGYRNMDERDPSIEQLVPKFHSMPMRESGSLGFLLSNSERIYKVLRKNKLSHRSRELKNRLFEEVGILERENNVDADNEYKVKYELDISPTQENIRSVYDYWSQNIDGERDDSNYWSDIGFKISGESGDYWLSSLLKKGSFDLNIQRHEEEVVVASSLLGVLEEQSDDILSIIE
ncbi:hypothetical protein [Rhodohalobacter mucosus]|uniref:Uncharacterized protein n=1 Tax=Rhodohalobacter mucosus TaxID=2079485 RepID=A0A316TS71_9BACT|nr:hypothetical protein [Rhodohalobacter mucosus]PWN06708.1 hypothetical protein DDZ15_09340 [Rhodohalobacter mucosus]